MSLLEVVKEMIRSFGQALLPSPYPSRVAPEPVSAAAESIPDLVLPPQAGQPKEVEPVPASASQDTV